MVVIKQGDLFPDFETVVRDEDGVAVDITDAVALFSMRKARDPSSVKIDGALAEVTSGAGGQVVYRWQSGDTDEPGTYEGEFHVTPFAGDRFRVPTTGYIEIVVEESVGS